MAKMTKREKQDARALAVKIADANRSRDYLVMAQMASEGRLVQSGGKMYTTPTSIKINTEV